jgi:hypothetical protein
MSARSRGNTRRQVSFDRWSVKGLIAKDPAMLDMGYSRERMVERQVERRGVVDGRVLRAMREVPREAFVPAGLQEFAYEDTPLPIEGSR